MISHSLFQQGYDDETKTVKDASGRKSFANNTSRQAPFDGVMGNDQPATVPRLFSGENSGIAPKNGVASRSYVMCTADQMGGGEVGGSANVFSSVYPQEKTTAETLGVKVPLPEKTTCQFTVVPEISHTRWGLGQESKQDPRLCNQTPHATVHAETQNANNHWKDPQNSSSHPSNINVMEGVKKKENITTISHDVNGLHNGGRGVEQSRTCHSEVGHVHSNCHTFSPAFQENVYMDT